MGDGVDGGVGGEAVRELTDRGDRKHTGGPVGWVWWPVRVGGGVGGEGSEGVDRQGRQDKHRCASGLCFKQRACNPLCWWAVRVGGG